MVLRRGAWSVQSRVIAAVLATTALALVSVGAATLLWGQAGVASRVRADHERAVTELRRMAAETDRATGRAWDGPDALLREALRRRVLAPSEGAMAIIDGEVAWTAQRGVALRPEMDRELVAATTSASELQTVTHGRMDTGAHDWAYVVVPVGFEGQSYGAAYVLATDMDAELASLAPVGSAYVLVGAGALVAVGLIVRVFVGRLLRPIAVARETAQRVSGADISQRIPVRGRDDLAALCETLNSMLDRLEGAVSSQRRMLDDVGHELRTPLTIARGHLEVVDVADRGDVEATRTLVIGELDRMRRLVDDLLTLARSGQPELLAPELVDVVQLADETLRAASGLGERRWALAAVAPASCRLDRQRVAQAWLQLAANAVQYSEPGTAVELGSAVDDGWLRLWVRDEGVGVAPWDRERIFERGESRGGGTGLGLAIVSAIATSHGGRVEVDSEPGVGSTFAIVLPADGPAVGAGGSGGGAVVRDGSEAFAADADRTGVCRRVRGWMRGLGRR